MYLLFAFTFGFRIFYLLLVMIAYFRTKRSPTGKILLKRWIPIRKVNKYAKIEKKFKTYRRKWWWDEYRWNQRHGI